LYFVEIYLRARRVLNDDQVLVLKAARRLLKKQIAHPDGSWGNGTGGFKEMAAEQAPEPIRVVLSWIFRPPNEAEQSAERTDDGE
jgi:hypothetical protein